MRNQAQKIQWLAKIVARKDSTPGAIAVAVCLADHHNCKTQQCNPSISTIQAGTNLSDRAVQRSLKVLQNIGALSIMETRGGKLNKTNSFKLLYSLVDTEQTPDTSVTPDAGVTPDTSVTPPPTPASPRTNEYNQYPPIVPPSRFGDFWAVWPRKVAKGVAEKAWKKAKLDNLADVIIQAASHQAAVVFKHTDKQYIPHPATWLNQKRWEDEIEAHQRSDKPKTKAEKIGDAIFGAGTEVDFLDMGEAHGEVWESLDEPDSGPKSERNHAGGMGGEIVPLQRRQDTHGGGLVDGRVPPDTAEDFRTFEAYGSGTQDLQETPEAEGKPRDRKKIY
ncbi:MAG: helix-turn-helix domain-containing protein [Candidatus Thiodiazotropha taylori]|uniref:Helix-turn-helix domain-containing protein n=1 Tax=Candidatus Thiodiazotropha taylori TaxID=2792791 RepID=A0A9E4K9Z0_9GAMM|nr:helix-turn-helix domain-containing protein [Candidatus Thiodiazotropha taylori]MCW4255958.1 helix-turn-helix domain-containing protein [Candidatus Thiodiazotropha taylori]